MGLLSLQHLTRPKVVKVSVGDGEDFVFMRSLTADELRIMQKDHAEKAGTKLSFDENLRLLTMVLVDEHGNQLTTEFESLRSLPTDLVVNQLVPKALDVSGMGEKKTPA